MDDFVYIPRQDNPNNPLLLYDVKEVAQILGVTDRTVYKLFRNGELKGEQGPDRRIKIADRSIDEYCLKHGFKRHLIPEEIEYMDCLKFRIKHEWDWIEHEQKQINAATRRVRENTMILNYLKNIEEVSNNGTP